MKFQIKKVTAGVAMALAVGLPAIQANAAISFNNLQGVGSGLIESFTVTSGNFLFNGIDPTKDGSSCAVTPTAASCAATSATTWLYGQSVISTFNLQGGGGLAAAVANEYTIVMKIPLLTYIAGTPVTLNALYNGASIDKGFFEIWADTGKDSNAHAGTGFKNGNSLILSGTVGSIEQLGLSNATGTGTPKILDNRSVASVVSSGPREYFAAGTEDKDGFKVASIQTTGSTTFLVDVTGGDAAYFPTLPASILAGFDINPFTPTLTSPFGNVAPTHSFAELGGPGAVTFGDDTFVGTPTGPTGVTVPAGTYRMNNFNCGTLTTCDFMAEGTAQGALDVVTIPEPGMLGLMGLGLAVLGALGRRRRS